MTGEGTLSIYPKSVTSGGTFKHMYKDGNLEGVKYILEEFLKSASLA